MAYYTYDLIMKGERLRVSKSEETAKDLLCDRCGKPVGDVWFMTENFEVVCIPCWKRGEGRVAG